MDRFRQPSMIAVMLLLIASMSVSSAYAYGRLPGRGIESGGDENPEQTLVGEPDWGGGGRPIRGIEFDLHVRLVILVALRTIGFDGSSLLQQTTASAQRVGGER